MTHREKSGGFVAAQSPALVPLARLAAVGLCRAVGIGRDGLVIDGAWKLRHSRLMRWLLLHGEWEWNHHRRPDVPWCYLPRIVSDAPQPSYLRQYWRLWRGPRLATEPAPESLRELPLSIHE